MWQSIWVALDEMSQFSYKAIVSLCYFILAIIMISA